MFRRSDWSTDSSDEEEASQDESLEALEDGCGESDSLPEEPTEKEAYPGDPDDPRNTTSEWLRGPAGRVKIPRKTGYRFLCQGFRLAQATFYNAAREQWPRVWPRLAEGPQEVLFGYGELSNIFSEPSYYSYRKLNVDVSAFPATEHEINVALYDMPHVRNAVCHFGGTHLAGPEAYDDLLRRCQRLAAVLGDLRRATRVQEIREQLRTEAETALDELEARTYLAFLPFATPWKHRQQATLRYAHRGWLRQGHAPNTPAAVRILVESWEE